MILNQAVLLNYIVGYETLVCKSSSLWPRYWLELLQSFQDQLKDKTPHLLNLARKGFLILKLAIIISLSTKIYYQDWKDIVTISKYWFKAKLNISFGDLRSGLNWELMWVFSPTNDMQEAFCSQSLSKEFLHKNKWNR